MFRFPQGNGEKNPIGTPQLPFARLFQVFVLRFEQTAGHRLINSLAHFSPAAGVRSDVIDDTGTKSFVAPVQQTPIVVVVPAVPPSGKQAWFLREGARFGTELERVSAQETHETVGHAAVREIIAPLPEAGLFTG